MPILKHTVSVHYECAVWHRMKNHNPKALRACRPRAPSVLDREAGEADVGEFGLNTNWQVCSLVYFNNKYVFGYHIRMVLA